MSCSGDGTVRKTPQGFVSAWKVTPWLWLLGCRVIPETSMDLMKERRSTDMERLQGWEEKEGELTQNLESG